MFKLDTGDRRKGRNPVQRYVGRQRGRQTLGVIDDHDLRLALDELLAGREALRVAYEISVWRREQRREAIAAAVAKLALASRAIDEVVERRGGICGDIVGIEP